MSESINKITVNNVSYDIQPGIATTEQAGIVKPDGTSILVNSEGQISASGLVTVTARDIDSESAEEGKVLMADGNGNTIWGEGGGTTPGGADWNAEEGEPGFIQNKPFYSKIQNVSMFPKTYWNNFSMTFEGNDLDNMDIPDEEWQEITGVPKNQCYCKSIMGMNLEQFKKFWVSEGNVLPTDEEIIENYGTWDNWAETKLKEEQGGFLVYLPDFNYTPGQIDDISKYINVSKEFKINTILKDSVPKSLRGSFGEGEYKADIDLVGNTNILNGAAFELHQASYILQLCGIRNVTNDDFLFEIGTLTIPMSETETVSYSIILFLTSNLNYVNAQEHSTTKTYTTKLLDGTTTITQQSLPIGEQGATEYSIQIKNFEKDVAKQVCTVLKLSASENIVSSTNDLYITIGQTTTPIQYWNNANFKIILDDQVLLSRTGFLSSRNEFPQINLAMGAGDHTLIVYFSYENMDFSPMDETIGLTFMTRGAVQSGETNWSVNPETATITVTPIEQITIDEKSYTYDTSFNYKINSAQEEIIAYLNDKFIKKPEWWFGEKEFFISTPLVFMKNIPGEVGGL